MAAGSYDLKIEKGATFQLTLTWKDEDGDPIDLTGFTARMQVRDRVDAEETLVELTTANGRIALGGAAGTIALLIEAAVTEGLPGKAGFYDLELVSAGGIVTRLLEGKAALVPEVTR